MRGRAETRKEKIPINSPYVIKNRTVKNQREDEINLYIE